MTFQQMPMRLSDLPTFAYTKAATRKTIPYLGRKEKRITRSMGLKALFKLYKTTSTYQGRQYYTRCVSEDVIDGTRWSDKDRKRPRGYPAGLRFPEDVMRAVLYSKTLKPLKSRQAKKKTKKIAARPAVSRVAKAQRTCRTCDAPADHIDELCTCTAVPWADQLTEAWRKENIELRLVSEEMGIGAFALQPLPGDFVLGEYLGELVSNQDIDSTYLFNITYDNPDSRPVACIDALRVGSWTRSINHSCDPIAIMRL